MTARGFCTCKRDHPGNVLCHPAPGASWHYLCDKPVLPPRDIVPDLDAIPPNRIGDPAPLDPVCRACGFAHEPAPKRPRWAPEPPRIMPTGTGWPVK